MGCAPSRHVAKRARLPEAVSVEGRETARQRHPRCTTGSGGRVSRSTASRKDQQSQRIPHGVSGVSPELQPLCFSSVASASGRGSARRRRSARFATIHPTASRSESCRRFIALFLAVSPSGSHVVFAANGGFVAPGVGHPGTKRRAGNGKQQPPHPLLLPGRPVDRVLCRGDERAQAGGCQRRPADRHCQHGSAFRGGMGDGRPRYCTAMEPTAFGR